MTIVELADTLLVTLAALVLVVLAAGLLFVVTVWFGSGEPPFDTNLSIDPCEVVVPLIDGLSGDTGGVGLLLLVVAPLLTRDFCELLELLLELLPLPFPVVLVLFPCDLLRSSESLMTRIIFLSQFP